MSITKLDCMELQDTRYSVYPYDGYNLEEILGKFYEAIKECNDLSFSLQEFNTWIIAEGLQEEVLKQLKKVDWDNVINSELYQTIVDRLLNTNNRIEEVKSELSSQLETIENVNTVISGVITTETNKSFNNSPIIQSFVDNLVINEKLTLPKGEYNCIEPIDLSKLPFGCKIDFQGILKFNNDNDGLIINAINSEIYIQGVHSKYKTYKDIPQSSNSVGIKLISLNKCNVIIKEVIGFSKTVSIIGDGTTNIDDLPMYRTKGTIYSDIKIDYLNGKTGLFLDKNYGYLNENVFFIKWLDCYDGIVFNENDTWFDPFNNNKLVYIGLENIEHDGIVLNNCRNSLIQTIRYENIGNKAIIEDKRCSGNVFINNYPINSSKLDLQGLRRVFIGNQGAEDFEPISQIELTDFSGTPVRINRGYHSELKNDTIFFDYDAEANTTFSDIFCKVKKSDGTIGNVYFDDYTTDGTLQATNTNATIGRKTKIIKVSSSTSTVEITTLPEIQQRGYSFYLITKYKTNPIVIKKSTGSVSISDLPTTGTYQIMYINDMWKALKISDDCDSWYF